MDSSLPGMSLEDGEGVGRCESGEGVMMNCGVRVCSGGGVWVGGRDDGEEWTWWAGGHSWRRSAGVAGGGCGLCTAG